MLLFYFFKDWERKVICRRIRIRSVCVSVDVELRL